MSRGEHEEDIVFAGTLLENVALLPFSKKCCDVNSPVKCEFRNVHTTSYAAAAHDPEDIWGPTFFYANGQYYGQTLCSDGHGPATSGRDCEVSIVIRNLATLTILKKTLWPEFQTLKVLLVLLLLNRCRTATEPTSPAAGRSTRGNGGKVR